MLGAYVVFDSMEGVNMMRASNEPRNFYMFTSGKEDRDTPRHVWSVDVPAGHSYDTLNCCDGMRHIASILGADIDFDEVRAIAQSIADSRKQTVFLNDWLGCSRWTIRACVERE